MQTTLNITLFPEVEIEADGTLTVNMYSSEDETGLLVASDSLSPSDILADCHEDMTSIDDEELNYNIAKWRDFVCHQIDLVNSIAEALNDAQRNDPSPVPLPLLQRAG